MKSSAQSPEYKHVTDCLVSMRKEAGLTQRELADLLEREQSFVWRIEKGERRVDLLEFHWICNAMGQTSSLKYARITEGFLTYESSGAPHALVVEAEGAYSSNSDSKKR